MSNHSNRIREYLAGGPKLTQAIWGLSREELHTRPADGSWSIHQIVTHLLESDLIGSDRMKRVACMDKPLLVAFDETAFANLPGVDLIDTFIAADLLHRNRQLTATILDSLPNNAWDRIGIHTEVGAVSLATLLEKFIGHLDHHLAFIMKKRTNLHPTPAS
jgi:uncharacterized damage-inducible protein DinB